MFTGSLNCPAANNEGFLLRVIGVVQMREPDTSNYIVGTIVDTSIVSFRLLRDRQGMSPIVATLILIIVAIAGAITVGFLLGQLTTDVSKRVDNIDISGIAGTQVLIAGSPVVQPVSQQLAEHYIAKHSGVKVLAQGGGSAAGLAALGKDIVDIAAVSHALTSDEISRYPGLKPKQIGGRAVVIIAHDDLAMLYATEITQEDLLTVYSPFKQALHPDLLGVGTVVRNRDMGSEEIFAGWLTDGQASSLDSYTATPDGVTMVDARDDAETYAIVSSTPGAIGFVNWLYVSQKDLAISHVNVLPVRNRANGNTQVPGDDIVVTEINNMNNENYDSGLVSQLFYVTDRSPSAIAEDYLNYAMSPDAIPFYRQAGAYSIFELKA